MLVHSRGARWAVWALFLVLFLPLFALPLLVVLGASFATNWSSALPSGFTTGHYSAATRGEAFQALTTSLLTAGAASLLALVVGTWAALAAAALKKRHRRFMDALFVLPVAVPSVVVGLAILVAFSKPPFLLNGTPEIVILALTLLAAPALSACGTGSASSDEKVVTVYSADGLKGENGDGWYDRVFKDFEKQTGIKVEYVEGGSGEMVQRAVREKGNPQADVLVTLPPFIQQADGKGLLQKYAPKGSDQVSGADKGADATWTSVVNNYFGFVYDKKELKQAPTTWEELLDGSYKNKLQYSTPGVAGDGTAVLIKAMHDFGGEKPAMDYLGRLQANNVGPSASTGKLAPKVDKGELLVANGDVQMNFAQAKTMPNLGIWFPAKEGGRPTTFALPYAAGLVTDAPHTENGRKLLDFMLSQGAQQQVSEIGGGFSARQDVKATDANAVALAGLMDGVEVFEPDWDDIDKNLTSYVDAWKSATGS